MTHKRVRKQIAELKHYHPLFGYFKTDNELPTNIVLEDERYKNEIIRQRIAREMDEKSSHNPGRFGYISWPRFREFKLAIHGILQGYVGNIIHSDITDDVERDLKRLIEKYREFNDIEPLAVHDRLARDTLTVVLYKIVNGHKCEVTFEDNCNDFVKIKW